MLYVKFLLVRVRQYQQEYNLYEFMYQIMYGTYIIYNSIQHQRVHNIRAISIQLF